jgi:hypothetical protein
LERERELGPERELLSFVEELQLVTLHLHLHMSLLQR